MSNTTPMPNIDDEGRYSTIEAATYLGLQPTTLRNARWSGKLCGTQSPRFIKYGSKVVYTGQTLREWRDQFEEHGAPAELATA